MRRMLFLIVVGIAGCSVLVALGVWQVRRLAWKEGLLAEMESRIADEPQGLPAVPDADSDRYLPVWVAGNFGEGELRVLVSDRRRGAGYRVIAPFETRDGRRILVDRGFVPVAAAEWPRGSGGVELSGHLHWPRETDSYTPAPDVRTGIWFARDVPAMAAAMDTEPVLLVAASRTDPGIMPMPVNTAAIPNDHFEYAVTWFSLAAIWAAMSGYFLWRTRARPMG